MKHIPCSTIHSFLYIHTTLISIISIILIKTLHSISSNSRVHRHNKQKSIDYGADSGDSGAEESEEEEQREKGKKDFRMWYVMVGECTYQLTGVLSSSDQEGDIDDIACRMIVFLSERDQTCFFSSNYLHTPPHVRTSPQTPKHITHKIA